VKELLPILIWVVVFGALFAFLWRRGYFKRLTGYVSETQEELKKCTWPSWDELKGSTVLVFITILMLGVFTVIVDWVSLHLVLLLT
jgi:preprotein translocase subunit SecE